MSTRGIIFDLQRFSLNDGPGIRTTVFLKGCPLHCLWCHNPESQSFKRQLSYVEERCTQCFNCVESCPVGAHIVVDAKHMVDFSRCNLSEECVKACIYGALSIIGQERSVEEIVESIKKDLLYYENSGGGVTLSGGEPMAQFDFALELLRSVKANGIHTCIETCGFAPQNHFKEILEYTDLFLFDYKVTDPQLHEKFTGVTNELIVSNLDFLCSKNAAIILRCPIIPGYNDTKQHFEAIASLSKKYIENLSVEIMPYHDLGASKARQIGERYLPTVKTVEDDQKQEYITLLKDMGCVKII